MTEKEEAAYTRGKRYVWQLMLQEAIMGLEMTGQTLESLILEREATVAALRSACEHHGDNEWASNLHLADVVEKHLVRHLPDVEE